MSNRALRPIAGPRTTSVSPQETSPSLRISYRHVGRKIPPNLRELTPEEKLLYPFEEYGYVRFEEYGPEKAPVRGSFWKQEKLDRIHAGCNGVTTMDKASAENIANNPKFYRSLYCSHCHNHFKVGDDGEFVWNKTEDRVGV